MSRPLATAPARTPEKRDPEATRRALLEAGASLFAERGYDGVAIDEVAARAGVNKALISYHFRGKRGLYVTILQTTFREIAQRFEEAEARALDAREALHGLLQAFVGMARERPGFPTLFLREVLASGIEPAVLPQLMKIVGVSRRLAERGARERLFRRVDPLHLHFALFGSLVFFFATEPARRKAAAEARLPVPMPDPPAFVRYLEGLTERGLAPARRASRSRRKGAHA